MDDTELRLRLNSIEEKLTYLVNLELEAEQEFKESEDEEEDDKINENGVKSNVRAKQYEE